MYRVFEEPTNGTTGQMVGTFQLADLPARIQAAVTADPEADQWVLPALSEGDTGEEVADLRVVIREAETTLAGHQIQHDASGVGHNWRNIDADEIPKNVILEIEGEMLDGGKEEIADFVASNGQHYRWS